MRRSWGSRLGSALVALMIAGGLGLSSLPVEAAGRPASHWTWRCATRHHVRHCTLAPHLTTWQRATLWTAVRLTAVPTAPPATHPRATPSRPTTTPVRVAPSGGPVPAEIALVNQDRAAAGLPPLRESAQLDAIATARAEDMARNGYFSHYRPGDSTLAVLELLRANGVAFTWYGENIIWESGLPADQVATSFNTWWMNSPEHRSNILNTHYGHIGVGEAVSGNRVYMVEDFTN